MFEQNQILRTLSAPRGRMRLKKRLSDESLPNRTAIARRVCEDFGFVDAKGRAQVATCAKALLKLEARGEITLPAPLNNHAAQASPRLLDEAVAPPVAMPATLGEVEGLAVVRVRTAAQRAVWNTLLHHEHPRGTTTLVGAQLRYLVVSAHGYLGAVGFSAPALRLAAREHFMAWSDAQRQAHLHRIFCLSRFLIRGTCKYLASHVLSRVLKQLSDDCYALYGYHPWLIETYVEPPWKGTCFKAANFLSIGYTAGGKRHAHSKEEAPKALFMYAVDRRWRSYLGVPEVALRPVRQPHEGMDDWVEAEFGDAPLGDRRLSTRLVKSASLLADVIGKPICSHISHDRAAVKAHYRLLSSKQTDVTPENMLAPHRKRTIERIRSQKAVLCIQDTTKLNFSTRPACEDLQVIGTNQTKAKSRGMPLHATLVTTTDGLPLGILRCSYRDPDTGPLKPRSQQWLDGFLDICEAAEEIPKQCRLICVMDREADNFALFAAQRAQDRVELLVRARHDRRLAKNKKLFATLRSGPAAAKVRIEIQRVTARPKSSRKKVRRGRSHRIAQAEVRYHCVQLPATQQQVGSVTMYGVHVREIAPPKGEKAVQWYLLTSMAVHSAEEAVQILTYYTRRWRVEDFFRVLKSGCKVERMAMRSAARLERGLAVYCVIACYVMMLTLLGRAVPGLDAELIFSPTQLIALSIYAKNVKVPVPRTLGAALLLVAVMGGYQNRTRDGPPGFQIMWRGLERLSIFCITYEMVSAAYREGLGYDYGHGSSILS